MSTPKLVKTINLEAQTVTFEVAGKETPLVLSLSELSPELQVQCALHGISQKVGDKAAGKDANISYTLMEKCIDSLRAGKWGVERTGGGAQIALYIEAVARIRGLDPEVVAARIDEMSDDDLKALKANPKVKATVDIIKGERAAAKAAAMEGEDGINI